MTNKAGSSPSQLDAWITQHREQLRARVEGARRPQGGKDAGDSSKQFIQNPKILSDAWAAIVRATKDLDAPQEVRAEAEAKAKEVKESIKRVGAPEADQQELLRVADEIHSARSVKEAKTIVQRAVREGKLPKSFWEKVTSYAGGAKDGPAASLTAMWNKGACIFCGAIAIGETGNLTIAVIACAICGLDTD